MPNLQAIIITAMYSLVFPAWISQTPLAADMMNRHDIACLILNHCKSRPLIETASSSEMLEARVFAKMSPGRYFKKSPIK